jgi:gas vesicle structural protein
MWLLLICPRCQTKLPLTQRICFHCGADLQNLPAEDRRYFIGDPGVPETPSAVTESTPEPVNMAITPEMEELSPKIAEAQVLEPPFQAPMPETPSLDSKDVSLCEALDRILNKGAVVFGEVMISVADIDLVYLGLKLILSSMETTQGMNSDLTQPRMTPNLFAKGAL